MNKAKFVYVGYKNNSRCAFCKANTSVEYIATMQTDYPEDSVVSPTRVYACRECFVKEKKRRMFSHFIKGR